MKPEIFYVPAIITVVYQLLYFFVAFFLQFDKVTDFAGGSNFLINAIVAFVISDIYTDKQIAVLVCIAAWSLRLAFFLLIRVLKAGEDKRFDEMRSKFFSFLGFWIFQMLWIYICSVPFYYLCYSLSDSDTGLRNFFSARDYAGLAVFLLGFLIEAISDQAKFNYKFYEVPKFKVEHPNDVVPLCKKPFWGVSRHPNYFGEIVLWWGIFMMCLQDDQPSVQYVGIMSPLFITLLLLFLSGIPLAESGAQKRYLSDSKNSEKEMYLEYRRTTSIIIPLPNRLYAILPLWFKRFFLFEFSIYETKYLKDAIRADRS